MLLSFINTISKIGSKYTHHNLQNDENCEIDLYINKASSQKACIHFLYGGRWTTGKKEEFKFVAHKFLKAGYHVSIADYRKHPDVKFPTFVEDAASGFIQVYRYLQENNFRAIPFYLMGHSSGAHLGAMLCTNAHYIEKAGGNLHFIQGFIGVSGPYKFIDYIDQSEDLRTMFGPPANYEKSQPILLAETAKNIPPMLLIHGGKDRHVLPLNTTTLANIVNKTGQAKIHILPKSNHLSTIAALGLPFWPFQTRSMMDSIHQFIQETSCRKDEKRL